MCLDMYVVVGRSVYFCFTDDVGVAEDNGDCW